MTEEKLWHLLSFVYRFSWHIWLSHIIVTQIWMSHIPHAVASWFASVMVVGDLAIIPGSGFTSIKGVPCVTPSWLWHDLFICVTWLHHTCDMCRSSVYDNCDMTHCSTATLRAASRLSSESQHSLYNIYQRFIWGTWRLFLSLLFVERTGKMKIQ